MVHGHSIGASAPFPHCAEAPSEAANSAFDTGKWRQLDADRRLQMIDRFLRRSDGLVDEYSLAL